MLSFLQVFVLLAFVLHRFLVLELPYYNLVLSESYWLNLICGLASDLSFVFFIWAPLQLLSLLRSNRLMQGVAYAVAICFIAALCLLLMIHVRYVEYFGMTARPVHFMTLFIWDVVSVGLWHVFDTWLPFYLLIGSAFGALAFVYAKRWFALGTLTYKSIAARVFVFVLLGAAMHSLMLNVRFLQGVHGELRYNAFFALYVQMVEFSHLQAASMPSRSEFELVRDILPGKRFWSDRDLEEPLPLWQERLASSRFASEEAKTAFGALRDHLASFSTLNVVFVLQESLRAHEIAGARGSDPDAEWLTPKISDFLAESVQFSETYSVIHGTGPGQVAALCSVDSWFGLELMKYSPMARANCLPRIFAARGYDTAFFYPDNNNYDNQSQFYAHQGIARFVDGYSFSDDTPRAGWGVSDHALFSRALDTFQEMAQPFFGVVLTLSNHGPFEVPEDAPDSIRRDTSKRRQLIQYVDWTWGEFRRRLAEEFPNTLVVFVADHGTNYEIDPRPGADPRETIRQVMRIPFALWTPSLPSTLQGLDFRHPVTNTDVAPTLMAALSWDEAQQFVGLNAFARPSAGFLMNWDGKAFMVRPKADSYGWGLEKIEEEVVTAWRGILRFNLLAPGPMPRSKSRDHARFQTP